MAGRDLRRGDAVYVTDDGGQRVEGRVGELTVASILVETGHGTRRLAAASIRRIELQDSLQSGIWIGVGLAVAGTYAACYLEARAVGDFCYLVAYSFLPAVAVGGFAGAMVDASTHKTLYKAPASQRLTVAPTVSSRSLGLQASLAW